MKLGIDKNTRRFFVISHDFGLRLNQRLLLTVFRTNRWHIDQHVSDTNHQILVAVFELDGKYFAAKFDFRYELVYSLYDTLKNECKLIELSSFLILFFLYHKLPVYEFGVIGEHGFRRV